ncbi:MAG: SGNH/GDSL hydrolase family protein [Candidatus Hydrogenedentes bacterium]|nr:SGNH/GDSL hydrolase family protein [Candidatus Hydrogenedentota bacterium]
MFQHRFSIRRFAVNLSLFGVSSLLAIFVLNGIVGRYLHVSDTLRQAPNARYHYEDDSFAFDVQLNSDGFREPELPVGKAFGAKRVVFLGDSMVFGWGANEPESFVRQAERSLNAGGTERFEAINLGVEGTSPIEYRDTLLSFGAQLQPDVIVLCYYTGNDAISSVPEARRDLRRPRFHQDLLRFYPSHLFSLLRTRLDVTAPPRHAMPGATTPNPLVEYLESTDPVVEYRIEAIAPAMLEKALQWRVNPYLTAGSITEPDILGALQRNSDELIRNPASRMVLEAIKAEADALEAELRVVLIPPGYTIDRGMWPGLEQMGYTVQEELLFHRGFQERMGHYCEALRVPSLDLSPVFQASKEPLYAVLDPHFTPAGNLLAGQTVAQWLLGAGPDAPAESSGEHATFQPVHLCSFDSDAEQCGWHAAGQSFETKLAGGALQLNAGGGELQLETSALTVDSSLINRVYVRMRSGAGTSAALYWGRPPGNTRSDYPFNTRHVAIAPIVSDGAFHTYVFDLPHLSSGWAGRWKALRFDPAVLHPSDEGPRSGEIAIDWMVFGQASPSTQALHPWRSIDALGWSQSDLQQRISQPGFQAVHTWNFEDGPQSWVLEGPGKLSALGGALVVESQSPVPNLRLDGIAVDGAAVNALRFTARAGRGGWGSFYWGPGPENAATDYPFANERGIEFPVMGDGVFHTYTIRLDGTGKPWAGQWSAIRLGPAFFRRDEGTMSGARIEVDEIALGYLPPAS